MILAGHTIDIWIYFHLIVAALLAMDLGIFNRKSHVIKMKEAIGWSILWICVGMLFGAYVWQAFGPQAGTEYFTGYLVEKSLSVDNLFVFAIIFAAFGIQREYQHRLLFWGIFGAIIFRAIMIALGTNLLNNFHWLIYVFGAFLVYTAIKLVQGGGESLDPKNTSSYRALKRFLPFSDRPHQGHFFVREDGKFKFTDFFAALIVVEVSDIMFAVDSVPAVFGITRDPFLVYTSNVMAILGLRSLFFVLEDLLARFHLLKKGLAAVLGYVGLKMCLEGVFKISPFFNLLIIISFLLLSVVLSLLIKAPLPLSEEDPPLSKDSV